MKELNRLTIKESLEGLKNKDFTSEDLTKSCIKRIEEVEDKVKAFVTTTFDLALEQAKRADEIIAEKGDAAFEEFPLLGIPYALKDNFSSKGVKTTASSKMLENYIPPFESTVSQKLFDAGAVLLGKTNMDAFAHGSSTETSDFKKTTNPWDTKRVPGGSSGGSASAVSANMCIFSIGSETAGSIRGPASWCGVTGFKPSYGRVSRYGVVAMASSTDQPGPICKSMWDASFVLKIIAGKDINDATSVDKDVPDYAKTNYSNLTVGIPKSYFDIEMDEEVKKLTYEFIEKLKELGFKTKEIDLISPKYSIGVYTIIQRSEVSSNLARLDGIRYGLDRNNFGFEAKKRMILGAHVLSSGFHDKYYTKAQKVRTLIINDFENAFKDVDLIVAPTMPITALEFGEGDKNPLFGEMMDILHEGSAVSGLCAISLPIGFSNGLPVGGQLIGAKFDEEKLAFAGIKYQEATDFHKNFPK
ncbi:MAG: Asp-tRNA(Asn)/Glu-tRNA(Gln) amidotransferase subunit GatA, partial [Proteobacteria bacterium]|nr:Asp-tRNA(Asn)/Glu-tRNA(Gln) amidotransferase subunit GatA [Pseudomonadota bacterium]